MFSIYYDKVFNFLLMLLLVHVGFYTDGGDSNHHLSLWLLLRIYLFCIHTSFSKCTRNKHVHFHMHITSFWWALSILERCSNRYLSYLTHSHSPSFVTRHSWPRQDFLHLVCHLTTYRLGDLWICS